jgi:hypothetical protein
LTGANLDAVQATWRKVLPVDHGLHGKAHPQSVRRRLVDRRHPAA